MTIDIMFMAKNQLVLRVNMCASNFENKILNESLLKRFGACVHHGYISEDYNIMGKFLDMMKII